MLRAILRHIAGWINDDAQTQCFSGEYRVLKNVYNTGVVFGGLVVIETYINLAPTSQAQTKSEHFAYFVPNEKQC